MRRHPKSKSKYRIPVQAFELGDIVTIGEINELFDEELERFQPIFGRIVTTFSTGKWGKVDEKTAWKNDMNVKRGEGRLVGLFETQFGTIEIVNTWNRERTELRLKQ